MPAKVTAKILPTNAYIMTQKKMIDWKIDKTGIVTIAPDQNGGSVTVKAVAKAKGQVILTATAQDGSGITATCTLNVNDK